MATAAEDNQLKTERRNRLDGGLNSRGSPTSLDAEDLVAVNDYRYTQAGSLVHRRYAVQLTQVTWVADGDLPAPTVTRVGAGGTIPAGDYEVKYQISAIQDSINLLTGYARYSAVTTILGVALNDALRVDIPPNNLGEQVGQTAAGVDDPLNGGPVANTSIAFGQVFLRKTTDAQFTQQLALFTYNAAGRVQRATVTSYNTGGGAPLATPGAGFPLRHIRWHPGIRRLIGWIVDRAVVFGQDLTTFTRFPMTAAAGGGVDNAGKVHVWSRVPSRMKTLILDNFMLAWDGVGRPKSLHWTGNVATSQWRLIGANKPAAAPTTADLAVGVLSAGTYKYVVTFTYRHTRGETNLTTADCESNQSAQSVGLVLGANRQVRVTLPTTLESGFVAINIYRTIANGGTFFFVVSVASGTATFDDNSTDAAIQVNDQPPDAPSKLPGNDTPPSALDFAVVHAGRIWAVQVQYRLDTSGRIIDTIATSLVFFTKTSRVNAGDVDQRENIDAWPFFLEVGESDPINEMVTFRGRIFVFKDLEIRVITGTGEDDVSQDGLFDGVGGMRDSVVKVDNLVYFWDQAEGPCVTDGNDFQPIGYRIMDTWLADKAQLRRPTAVWHDRENQEIHWQVSDLSLAPDAHTTNARNLTEYVYYIPTKRWGFFTTAADGTGLAQGRAIGCGAVGVIVDGTTVSEYVYKQLLANFNGLLLREDATSNGTDDSAALAPTASATFKFFFGDSWEMSKDFRFLFVYADILSGTMTALMATLSAQAFVSMGTVAAQNSGATTSDVVGRIPFKASQIVRPGTGGVGKMNRDRALLVKMTSNLSLMKIKGLSLKYKDYSDEDAAV